MEYNWGDYVHRYFFVFLVLYLFFIFLWHWYKLHWKLRRFSDFPVSIRNVGILMGLKVIVDGGVKSLWEKFTERRSQMFYKPTDVFLVRNVAEKSISSISMCNIVNQSGKHNFFCD